MRESWEDLGKISQSSSLSQVDCEGILERSGQIPQNRMTLQGEDYEHILGRSGQNPPRAVSSRDLVKIPPEQLLGEILEKSAREIHFPRLGQ